MEIIYSKTAAKVIKTLDKDMKKQIKYGIEGLTEVPPKGDIKQIKGMILRIYRLRIGKYRVIYEYTGDMRDILLIKEIGSRGDIYK